MPNWKAYLIRTSGLIKRGEEALALLQKRCLIKVENV